MLGKVKQLLGIEGVVVELIVPDQVSIDEEELTCTVVLTSKSKQVVNSILVQFIERFSRGSKKDQRIDEYVIGKIFLEGPLVLSPDQSFEKEVTLQYKIVQSEMDKFEDQNFIFKGLVKVAKYFNKVKSEYRLEAEVDVKGTTLNPIVKEILQAK